MSYIYFNNNPRNRSSAGDCTVRALSLALGWDGDWEKTYAALCVAGLQHGEMPSSNEVWGSLLLDNGYVEHSLMQRCKDCYTLVDFCNANTEGEYVVCTGTHAIYCKDGNFYDSWDSGDVIPTFYFEKVKNKEGGKK